MTYREIIEKARDSYAIDNRDEVLTALCNMILWQEAEIEALRFELRTGMELLD